MYKLDILFKFFVVCLQEDVALDAESRKDIIKKCGCPCKIVVKHVVRYPEYKVRKRIIWDAIPKCIFIKKFEILEYVFGASIENVILCD